MDGLIDVIKDDVIPIVGKAAPLLAGVLGTPFASVAISLIAHAFGVNPKDAQGLAKVMQSDPEAAIKLKTLEYDHSALLAKISAADYANEIDDRKDARKYGTVYKDFMRHMTFLVTAGFLAALFLLFIPFKISEDERNLLSMLVGMLASKWQTIIDFYFGSSRNDNQGVKNGRNLG